MEKLIQQVLDIERQAQATHDEARREAEKLTAQAELEAQALIERERAAAEEEARRLVENAQATEECARILSQAEEEAHRAEALAMNHMDRAVGFVLDQVAGRE